jgi:vancomycin permeability regulator SanA
VNNSKLLKPYDVIVIFGAAVWDRGQPSPALKRRLKHAVQLYREGYANILLATGGIGNHPPSEAVTMKKLALEDGIPPSRIITEEEGTSTLTSAKECIRIMRANNWTSAMVVSDSYHLLRALFVFRCLGIQADSSAPKSGRCSNSVWKWFYYYLREYAALPFYIGLVFLEVIKTRKKT